jgi:hypothetical protein
MLSSKIEITDREVYSLDFIVTLDGIQLSKFYFPVMSWEELQKLISGEDVEDQNHEGFSIEQKDGKVTINIQSNLDCDEVYYTTFILNHDICLPAFKELVPHYIAKGRDKEVFQTYEEGIPSEPEYDD